MSHALRAVRGSLRLQTAVRGRHLFAFMATRPDMRTDIFFEAARRPFHALRVVRALAKGYWYKVWYPLIGIRFRAGRNLRVNGTLSVRGPGEVILGNDVLVNGHATPWTYSRGARIEIGDNVILGSTRFGCVRQIVVGPDCLLASAQFTDTNFHSTHADRRSASAPVHVAPVRLDRNVWVAENAACLPGTEIGENSVVGFGSICSKVFPANVVILGNPGRVVGRIPQAGMAGAADATDGRTSAGEVLSKFSA